MIDQELVRPYLESHQHPLVFVTMSGAHLYGFDSPDSDYDLRGMHAARVRDVIRLSPPDETVEVMDKGAPIEIDLVTHDLRKYAGMLLKRNGYVLEQVYSPIVVLGGPLLDELREICKGCITRNHRHHYRGFAENQWKMVTRGPRPTVKGLLYTYRVLLAGIHLMRTGIVEANLRTLNGSFRLGYIDDLIARKTTGAEKQPVGDQEVAMHEREFNRLRDLLESASLESHLPEEPSAGPALEDFVVRVRLGIAG